MKMKSGKYYKIIGLALLTGALLQLQSCEDYLEPEEFSQVVPDNLFSSVQGIESVLFGAYAKSAEMQGSNVQASHLSVDESLADLAYSINSEANRYREYDLDPGNATGTLWTLP